MDISRVAELKGVTLTEDRVEIGAGTTWAELVAADLPHGFDGLKAAALEVGSIQVQNRGTIAGHPRHASPASPVGKASALGAIEGR